MDSGQILFTRMLNQQVCRLLLQQSPDIAAESLIHPYMGRQFLLARGFFFRYRRMTWQILRRCQNDGWGCTVIGGANEKLYSQILRSAVPRIFNLQHSSIFVDPLPQNKGRSPACCATQWRSQDSKFGYSYFHVNKKNKLFLTAMSENTTKYEPI